MIADLGLLASRLALGLGLASHGAQKAFGWFEGPGPEGAAGFMAGLGFKPGEQFAQAASYNEIASGLLIALGLGGPLGPAGLISGMVVAMEAVHRPKGFFAGKNGVEVPVLYSAGALALATVGYGALSFDSVLGLDEKLKHPVIVALALAGGLTAAWLVLGMRDDSPPDGTLATPTIKGAERNGRTPAPAPAAN